MNNRPFLPAALLSVAFLTICDCQLLAQDIRTFNQNSSRSNNATRAFNQNASRSNHTRLSFSLSPVYSTPLKNDSDSLLFRGSGTGLRLGAEYFMGKAGIGFISGFGSSSPDNTMINNFLKRTGVPQDQLVINKANQQNMYLLVGPSVRFGNIVEISAHAKGGMFINSGGLVSIQQRGAQRAAYRNESTGKSIYPGFVTGLNVQYNTRSDIWSFGIGADYMNTKTEVNNFDARRGGAVEGLKLSHTISDIVAGISIRYNISTTREAGSGRATGRRNREAGSGMATGRRTYQPGQPVYGNINREAGSGMATGRRSRDASSGLATGRRSREAGSGMATGRRVLPTVNKREIAIDEPGVLEEATESCGPVTTRTTYPDGTEEEMTFSCPDDAANYNNRLKIDGGMPNRISMNVTVPKQTQGATFGEKVNAGLHAAGSALSQGRNIISGRLSVASESSAGIITNKTAAVSSVGSLSGSGSGAAAASYARMGAVTTLYAREKGSGQASGRRERGSGLATGRRQYEPVFSEEGGTVCDPCIATVKLSNTQNNPYFKNNGNAGDMVSMIGGNGTTTGAGNNCDGIAGIVVSLLESGSRVLIAKTTTEAYGDFFFANIPDGDYILNVSGSYLSKKGYDYYQGKSDMNVLGQVALGSQTAQLLINTEGAEEMTQKAGISTSRSNIRTKSVTIIDADTDGDGSFESTKVLAELMDGTVKDITTLARVSTTGSVKKVTVRGWDPEKKESVLSPANNAKEFTITIGSDNKTMVNDQPAIAAKVTHHPNVVQYVVPLNETATDENEIWSPRTNIKRLYVSGGDVDGDGRAETIVGNAIPGAGILSSARIAGDPIHGVDVKLGNTVGKVLRSGSTNEDGEFEFTGLDAGNYVITMEQQIVIEDETFISVGYDSQVMQNRAQDHNSSRSNKTASAIDQDNNSGNTKAQDHNSTRSNKTASIVSNNPDNGDDAARKGWDGTVKGGSKAQDHNSSRSNKSGIINNDPDNTDDTDGIAIDEGGQSRPKAKANVGPVKWAAPEAMQRTINTSRSNIKNQRASLDDLEEQLDTDQSNAKASINTTRSNIKNQRAALDDLDATLGDLQTMDKNAAMKELEQKSKEEEKAFLQLLASLKNLGSQYSSISNVLKTKHDTAKNSIGNIR